MIPTSCYEYDFIAHLSLTDPTHELPFGIDGGVEVPTMVGCTGVLRKHPKANGGSSIFL